MPERHSISPYGSGSSLNKLDLQDFQYCKRYKGFVVSWYSKHLIALKEPSIYKKNPKYAYRFTWLRTFDDPIAVRVEIYDDGKEKLFLKRSDGKGAYDKVVLTIQTTLVKCQESGNLKAGVWDQKLNAAPINYSCTSYY